MNGNVLEFFRFCIVGILCTTIDATIFYLTYIFLGYRISMICGFVISLSVNYILNMCWTFRTKPSIKNGLRMLVAHCFNIFVVRMFLMWLFINVVCMQVALAYVPTLLISVMSNFIIIRYWVVRL